MKFIYLTITVVLSVLVLAPLLLTFTIRYVQLAQQPPNSYTEKVYGENKIIGKINALGNNLSVIGVSIRNPNLLNKNDIILRVLKEDGQEIRTSSISGWTVPDGDLVKFSFAPITDSRSKNYVLEFSSPASGQVFPFEIFMTEDKNISSIQYFKPSSRQALIKRIYGDFSNKFFADKLFFSFYSLLILFITFLLIKKSN